jgi:uncharacterized phage protein gp47/JayE
VTSQGDYIDSGARTDPDTLRDLAVTSLQEGIPGLVLQPGHPIWLTFDAFAELAADLGLQLDDNLRARFRTFGREVIGLPSIEATAAASTITITTSDPDPDGETERTIPAGAQVAVGDEIFLTSDDVTIAEGDSGQVAIVARSVGAQGSGLTATPEFKEPYGFIATVVLDAITTGGRDAETETDYDAKLARRLQHQGRPILEGDFSERAREVVGVARALTLDGYDAIAETSGHEKTVTIAVVDENGAAVSGGVKTSVQTLIESEREINWVVYVIDPTYTTIDITAAVTVWDNYTASDVEAQCVTALGTFLNPAAWGTPPTGEQPEWHDEPIVLLSEVYTVLNNVDGVRHVTSLTIGAVQAITAAAATDLVTLTGHGFSNGDEVTFSDITGGAPLVAGTSYYVRDVSTDTFKVAATLGGAAINLTTDLTVGNIHRLSDDPVTLALPAPLPLAGDLIVTAS